MIATVREREREKREANSDEIHMPSYERHRESFHEKKINFQHEIKLLIPPDIIECDKLV